MIDPATLQAILEQYARHGWKLRRVLLSAPPPPGTMDQIGDAEIRDSEIDALWFSRRSLEDAEAWELRRLTGSPFALVTVLPDEAGDDEKEGMLAETEERMSGVSPSAGGH